MVTKVYHSLADLPPSTALAVGNFDGVHQGHQAILARMLTFAKQTGRAPWILSFEGSPKGGLDITTAPERIYDLETQTRYLLETGATLIRQPFTSAFSNLTATDFLTQLNGAEIFCGEDWRFGKGAQGNVAFLTESGAPAHVVPYILYEDARISSTRIRAALADGAMDLAAAMLGRVWEFTGVVQHGRGLAGKTFGVPTLNLPYCGSAGERLVTLAHGVYHGVATVKRIDGNVETFNALINFGTAPSVKGLTEPLFEVHLLDACGDFYGCEVTLRIAKARIRSELKFDSLTSLQAQILEDLAHCREGIK